MLFMQMRTIRKKAIYSIASLALITPILFFIGLRTLELTITFRPTRYEAPGYWNIPKDAEEVWIQTSDNVRLNGWYLSSQSSPANATILFFHGNSGNISNVSWLGESLSARGFNVLLIDYRGY